MPTCLNDDLAAPVPAEISATVKVLNFFAVTTPFVGFVAAMFLLWGRGFNWMYAGIMSLFLFPTAMSITIGFHRLFTHRSFETIAPIKFMLGVLGSMALEGPIIKWCVTHRYHHQHSDHAEDVHSPYHHGDGIAGFLKGFWHAHVGWFFAPEIPNLSKYAKDLIEDPIVAFVSRTFWLWVFLGLALPALIAGLVTMTWTGALLGLIWGGLVRLFIVHHMTWSINSVCHIWGSRTYRSHDESRNNVIFGIVSFGEGWHNNHHAFPTSARHGLAWWQFDMSWMIIRTLELLGLAWKVRLPSDHQMAAKRIEPVRGTGFQPVSGDLSNQHELETRATTQA
jgi:stearoyl-CoA desaturase (delta-9 desaturase)